MTANQIISRLLEESIYDAEDELGTERYPGTVKGILLDHGFHEWHMGMFDCQRFAPKWELFAQEIKAGPRLPSAASDANITVYDRTTRGELNWVADYRFTCDELIEGLDKLFDMAGNPQTTAADFKRHMHTYMGPGWAQESRYDAEDDLGTEPAPENYGTPELVNWLREQGFAWMDAHDQEGNPRGFWFFRLDPYKAWVWLVNGSWWYAAESSEYLGGRYETHGDLEYIIRTLHDHRCFPPSERLLTYGP